MPVDPVFAADLARDLDPEDYARVLRLFRQDVVQLSETITRAAAAGDDTGFRRAAHGLAGAAGAVGAKALEAACRIVMAPRAVIADHNASAREIADLVAVTLLDITAALARVEGQ